ncbi:quercetin 2,3-dioxygenase [Thermocatellispora tengchongensis]|uniref:Quercetin 2,3-dioxygenase n=1 Tax=Thermocatellispora tengchongensis TaxID=1073253 RepID=A0A840P4D3_9ACTN|nr:quercetin 2,3-dioxygenase [Thermocatellispora tengchongensis]MBB5133366.1 quercetin 2,3-dioxygenase [Thermocatellispora tengchongensis]
MSLEYLIDPEGGPQWRGILPGAPEAYFLKRGEGEHAMLFTDLFTVLLSGDETEGQFGVFTSEAPAGKLIPAHVHRDTHETFYVMEGKVRVHVRDRDGTKRSRLLEPGDFGFVPAGLAHAYQVEERARMLGVATGGFERFFQHMGRPTDHATADQPPFVPDLPRMQAAAREHNMEFLPDLAWPDAEA